MIMREHKYRAWDKRDKRMIVHEQEFIPLKVTSIGVFRLSPTHEDSFYTLMDPDRFDLTEYTGLKDKNGKEIYEGDMLKGHCGEIQRYVVAFTNGSFDLYHEFARWGLLSRMFEINDMIVEVIGNIHENPELI